MKQLAIHRTVWAKPPRLVLRLVLVSLVIGLLAVPVLKILQLGVALQQAYQQATGFSRLLQGQLDASRVQWAHTLLANSADAVARADATMDFFRPWLEQMAWVPRYGKTLAALPALSASSAALSQLAVDGFALFQPLLADAQGTLPIERLPTFIATARPQLALLQQRAAAVEQQLAAIPAAELHGGLAEPVEGLQAAVGLFTAGLRLSEAAPDLLALKGVRTYLILVQNNHELRATGGFITSIGRLTIADGQILTLEFADSYAIDNVDLPHPAAPAPMQRYMSIDRLFLRDINWSPDLPITARLAQMLYQQNSGQVVDGVITVDLTAVELFVEALAPLQVPGVADAITAENFLARAQELWAAPAQSNATLANNDVDWWRQRKDFIPQVAQAAVARLRSGDFHYLRLVVALQRALARRALQLWFVHPGLQAEMRQLHWDGGLHPIPAADFLAVVESNLGYNKVNAVVERAVEYQVQWPPDAAAPGVATLTLTYRHPHAPADQGCDPRPRYGLTYADMIARCYFSFVRIYTPAGSTLLDSSGFVPDSVVSQPEGESQQFGGYFVLAPSEQTQIRLRYQLPARLQAQNYRLVLQKQAGTAALPFTAQVDNHALATTIQSGWFTWQP